MGCGNSTPKLGHCMWSKSRQSSLDLILDTETNNAQPPPPPAAPSSSNSKSKRQNKTEVFIPLTLLVTVIDCSRSETLYRLRIKSPAERSLHEACAKLLGEFGDLESVSVCTNLDRYEDELRVIDGQATPRSLNLVNGTFVEVRLVVFTMAKLGPLSKFFSRHCGDDYHNLFE